MKLKHRFANWLLRDQNNIPIKDQANRVIGASAGAHVITSVPRTTFSLYKGIGGIVVEIEENGSKYATQKNPYGKIYILPDTTDLGEELAKIITAETLISG